jgi:hypothetical protein
MGRERDEDGDRQRRRQRQMKTTRVWRVLVRELEAQ